MDNNQSFIDVSSNDSVLVLRINNPKKANAYSSAMLDSLEREMRKLHKSKNIRVVILTGTGSNSFCAGADKDELKQHSAIDGLYLRSREIFEMWANLPAITIASINGHAVGGGLELALACDIRVCCPHAQFFLPEVSMGLTPAAGGMRRLALVVGKSKAKEIILFDRKLDAYTALDWGLVSYVGDDYEVMALELAKKADAKDLMAICLAKKVIDSYDDPKSCNLEAIVQAFLYEQKQNWKMNYE